MVTTDKRSSSWLCAIQPAATGWNRSPFSSGTPTRPSRRDGSQSRWILAAYACQGPESLARTYFKVSESGDPDSVGLRAGRDFRRVGEWIEGDSALGYDRGGVRPADLRPGRRAGTRSPPRTRGRSHSPAGVGRPAPPR